MEWGRDGRLGRTRPLSRSFSRPFVLGNYHSAVSRPCRSSGKSPSLHPAETRPSFERPSVAPKRSSLARSASESGPSLRLSRSLLLPVGSFSLSSIIPSNSMPGIITVRRSVRPTSKCKTDPLHYRPSLLTSTPTSSNRALSRMLCVKNCLPKGITWSRVPFPKLERSSIASELRGS